MKLDLSLLTTATLLAVVSQVSANYSPLSIGMNADDDLERKMPFSWTVGAQIGYDSNVGVTSSNEESSTYLSAGIGVSYSSGDRRTALSFRANYSPLWYLDSPRGVDDFQNNANVGIDYRHRVNPRLVITNSLYAAYEVQPDFSIGASVARRTEPYFYGYNSLSAAYSWTRRFSTVTTLLLSGVDYDGGSGADFWTWMISEELRYAFSRTTTGTFTYRFAQTDSDAVGADYDTHYVLVGADHRFSPRLTGSARVGASFQDGDSTPYAETALSYRVSRKTEARWYSVFGFPTDGSMGDASFRSGLTASHRFNTRFSGNLGLHYIGEDYDSFEQDIFAVSAGFNYLLYRNISLNGGYSLTNASSDNDFAEFTRHMFQLGVSARF